MKAPVISVCLPTYNGAKFVAEAIDSVLNQSFQDFEIVIGDDGSSDDTKSIVEGYAKNDGRISYVFNRVNLGYLQNTNCILERCRGEYVKTFAQDDVFVSSCFEKMLAAMVNNPGVALVSASRQNVDEAGNETEILHRIDQPGRHSGHAMIKRYLREFVNRHGNPSQMFFRRVDALDGFDAKYYHSADVDFGLRLLQKGDLFYLTEPLIRYRVHNETTTITTMQDMSFAPDHVRLVDRFASEVAGEVPRQIVWQCSIEGLINKMSNAMYVRGIKYDRFPPPKSWSQNQSVDALDFAEADRFRRLACHLAQYATENQRDFEGLAHQLRDESSQITAIATHNEQISEKISVLEEQLRQMADDNSQTHKEEQTAEKSLKKWRNFFQGKTGKKNR